MTSPTRSRPWRWPARFRSTAPARSAAAPTAASPSSSETTRPSPIRAGIWPVLKDKDAQFLPYLANFGQSAREGAHSAIFDWNPGAKKFRVFSGGNRNAYDYGYNLAGEAFLFDSDMEWDIGLPCVREVRTAHRILNGNYGYRTGRASIRGLRRLAPPVRDLGRGSPVGVEFYASYAYPKEFFDNLFEADWSRGRLVYTALTPNGATYSAESDRAEFVHGEPFNITDVEVGPDGMMSIHDRWTEHHWRAVAPALHGHGAGGTGHDRHPRGRAPSRSRSRAGAGPQSKR